MGPRALERARRIERDKKRLDFVNRVSSTSKERQFNGWIRNHYCAVWINV